MPSDSDNRSPEPDERKRWIRPGPSLWLPLVVLAVLISLFFIPIQPSRSRITYRFFFEQLQAGNVQRVTFSDTRVEGEFVKPPAVPPDRNEKGELVQPKDDEGDPKKYEKKFWFVPVENLSEARKEEQLKLFDQYNVDWGREPESQSAVLVTLMLYLLLPIALLVFLWFMFRRTRDQIMGGGFLSGFSKSTAQRYENDQRPVTFKDVAGLEGVKLDLQEIIDFLKDPKKFQRLGGQVPKGVLLLGPPGTGKTLLARAVAGEAGVPFFSVNGSEFIQMFVGVGASRVRDLFKTAKESAPAIVFIDEIDAVGRQRGAGLGGGHDEREQTLNQILSAMDGFTPNETVIVIAATNRPDVLDPALLRPGRFDRHITVDRPTLKGREAIFKVHVRDVPLADNVDLKRLAAGTVGMTGADIRNLVNEAALWATRQDKNMVEMSDFEVARDKVLMGPRREELLNEKEKEKTAYHEAGHALLAWILPGVDRVHKVTVVPRGRALGVTQTLPEEDRMSISETELRDRLAFLLGGRAAEKLVYDEYTAGGENDLEHATNLARRMVTTWGMSERLGPVNYKITSEDPFLGREMHEHRQFSEHTMQLIDEEVMAILQDAAEKAIEILTRERDKLNAIAEALIEQEEVDEDEITELIGPSIHAHKNADEAKEGPKSLEPSTNGQPDGDAADDWEESEIAERDL